MKYTPLHCHSDASLLDGLSQPSEIVERLIQIGADGGALTDHGSICNYVAFTKAMTEKGLKPILGVELYICDQHASIKNDTNRKLLHMVILAKNDKGWEQILKIIHTANSPDHYYYKPRLSLNQLSAHLDGNIIAFSGHLGSHISAIAIEHGVDAGVRAAKQLEDMFGQGNFWLECQLMDKKHNPDMEIATKLVREISSKTGIPCIATPDAHYCAHEDAELQRIILCSNMKVTLKKALHPDFMLRGFFISDNYHIPTYEEMIEYGHTPEELENTNVILSQIEKYTILKEPQLPKFDCPNGMNDHDYLTQLCRDGWVPLVKDKIPKEQWLEYRDRVVYELGIIKESGLSSYFLILWDIIQFCHKNGWLTGPGRGSAAGCLVSYLIGITQVDPIEYGLIFERFYDVPRKGSMPDIDLDVMAEHREEIQHYLREKYGQDKVTQIMTFQNMKGARALSEVMRAYGDIPHEEIKRITSNIIEEHRITDQLQEMQELTGESSIIRWCLENRAKQFEEWCKLDEEGNLTGPYAQQFRQAIALEGVKAAQSKHAAGIVISTEPLYKTCPMILDVKNQQYLGGLVMGDMEAIGLVKLDLLSINVLDKMAEVAKLNPNFIPDARKIPRDDYETWELIKSGKTLGVFQFDSKLGQSHCKKLMPENIEHLSALSAAMRPGCMESLKEDGKSITEHYIMRKNNLEPVTYIHPSLEPILGPTYGEMIYQEQALRIAKDIAGFSLGQANTLRKAIGKKKADVMAKVKGEFATGIETTKVVPKEIGDQLFEWIEKSQRYSFNKSHSVCYGHISYLSAYAKAHYTKEFFTAYLLWAHARPKPFEEIYQLVNDAKSFGIYVMPPNLRRMNTRFDLIEDKIYFGLSDIKHVGDSVIVKMNTLMKQWNLDIQNCTWLEFLVHIADNVNSRAMEAMINAGACDCFNMPRIKMLYEYNIYKELSSKPKFWIGLYLKQFKNLDDANLQSILEDALDTGTGKVAASHDKRGLEKLRGSIESLRLPPYTLIDKPHQIAQMENTLLGVCVTATFLDESNAKYKANCSCQQFNEGFNSRSSYISIACQVDGVVERVTKKGRNPGQEMATIIASDDTGIADGVVVFPEYWAKYKDLLVDGNRVLLTGKRDKNGSSLSVETVEQI